VLKRPQSEGRDLRPFQLYAVIVAVASLALLPLAADWSVRVSIVLLSLLAGSATIFVGWAAASFGWPRLDYYQRLIVGEPGSLERIDVSLAAFDVQSGLKTATGYDGTVVLDQGRITIQRRGLAWLMTLLPGHRRSLSASDIQLVLLKHATSGVNGYIRFVAEGQADTEPPVATMGLDPVVVFFKQEQEPAFREIFETLRGTSRS
jgi:hypothetical protein